MKTKQAKHVRHKQLSPLLTAANEPAPEPPPDDPTAPPIDGSVLTAADERFISRVGRLLVGLSSAQMFERARREGYSAVEHAEGWRLLRIAGGENRALDDCVEELGADPSQASATILTLERVDAFENTWFPRARAIMRRVVPRDERETFVQAFFTNLEQQPLGPGVLRSVGMFLTRVDSLATSEHPSAKAVLSTLEARGLTPARRAEMKRLISNAEKPQPRPTHNPDVARAQAEQRAALEDLRDWYNDWGTSLRPAFGPREQTSLGLTIVTRAQPQPEPVPENPSTPANPA